MSLAARHLEANGIPTVIIGSAKDVVEYCGVPRFVFTDLPLGNPIGPPDHADVQIAIVGLALDMLSTATAPRTTWTAPVHWNPADDWRPRYARVDASNIARLHAMGEERRRQQSEAARLKRGE